MNNIVFNYLIKNFLKTFLLVVAVIYCFGVVLNLFEEVEFFKNTNTSILTPLVLTCIFVPSVIIKLLPFIIFISCMWFMVKIRNNKDLLTLKIYGYSNIKIFFILAFTSFMLGWIVLTAINPLTSSMVQYYEKTKSKFARDIDHLITFNKNGLWIKESLNNGERIIKALRPDGFYLEQVEIFHLNKDYSLKEKIFSERVNIKKNTWKLEDVIIFELKNNIVEKNEVDIYEIKSIYNYEKINTLFSNADSLSFLDLVLNYNHLLKKGYSSTFLDQNLHSMLSLPFFLFLMTSLASILTLYSLKRSDNLRFIVLGMVVSVLVYYFKDLSVALGQTDRIPLNLSIWSPIIALSLFTFIGVLQINEK